MKENLYFEKVELGIISKPFGINGEIQIKPFANKPMHIINAEKIWVDDKVYDLIHSRSNRNKLIVKFKNINTIDQAATLRGKIVSLKSNSLQKLEEHQYYHYQILGCLVIDKTNGKIGNITQIIETGSNDVYVVSDDKIEYLIPATKNIVLNIDLIKNIISVDLPDALRN